MAKRVVSIELGVWWTKVSLVDYRKKMPQIYTAFTFRTPEHAVEDGYIRDKEQLSECLKRELLKRNIREREVVFTLSSSKVVTREVRIPEVKDSKLDGIIKTQSREFFPMDVSNYTVTYHKMESFQAEGVKQMKLLLVAVPDNLLNNYYTFAGHAGLTIESFDYIGNCAVSYMSSRLTSDAMIVQLEEQATVISVIRGRKLVFQRITPYGYDAALSTVLEHPVLKVKDEYEAFDFLTGHDILYNLPNVRDFEEAGDEDREKKQQLLNEAFADMKESLSYYIRIVYTALEYYQNQVQEDFRGRLYLIGDGARFSNIKRLFAGEIPLEFVDADYGEMLGLGKEESGDAGEPLYAIGMVSVTGAAISPLNVKPKELKEKESKKSDLKSAYVILAVSALASIVLILTAGLRYLFAKTEQRNLADRMEQLAYVQEIFDENARAGQKEQQYIGFDAMTVSKNEQLADLIPKLEAQLPKTATVQSLSIAGDTITLNISCDKMITAASLLMNFGEISMLTNVTIPSVAENVDEAGNNVWQFTVMADYQDAAEAEETDNGAGE